MLAGKNSWKIEGYFLISSMGRDGICRESLDCVMMFKGIDFDGSDLIRFLMLRSGLRFFSLSTAWSSPRSLT